MGIVVRHHYPAANLPDDLKAEIGSVEHVTITIEAEERPSRVMSLDEIFALADTLPSMTREEIDDHIRDLREDR